MKIRLVRTVTECDLNALEIIKLPRPARNTCDSLTKFVTDDNKFYLYLEMAPIMGKGLSGRSTVKESMAIEGRERV